MGVKLRGITHPKPISFGDLNGKKICIDSANTLYQFLAIIRQPDGTPLKDHTGKVTSHLSGLFYRTINLYENGIKPIYVFDGVPPKLKKKELERRKESRESAETLWKRALEIGDLELARKYAQASSRLTDELVEDACTLLEYMGIPYIKSPQEGEAQAAYMAKKGDCWAVASQDYDALLFGAPRLVRNLTISGRRKLPGKKQYIQIQPEIIFLDELIDKNSLTLNELILCGILVGTDFNKGLKGCGAKTAVKLLKKYSGDLNKIYEEKGEKPPENLQEIMEVFQKPLVTDNYKISWEKPQTEEIIEFLCRKHDFSLSRVQKALNRLVESYNKYFAVTGLEKWF